MKPIHAYVNDPHSGFHLFKPSANDTATSHVVYCNASENCSLHKKGQCVVVGAFGSRCPHGRYEKKTGYTKRARGYHKWIGEERLRLKGIPSLTSPKKKLAVVGDYIYVPYAHANMNEKVKFLSKGGFLMFGSDFIHKNDWNLETVLSIITFVPYAMMGGAISSYWTEEVPLFILHLEEVMPDMYAELVAKHDSIVSKYIKVKNYVGRTALLKTVPPCTFKTKGSRDGSYSVEWVWDGVKLTTSSPHAYNSTWGEVDKYESISTTIIPNDKSTIKITDNSQVNSTTEFID